MAKKLLYAVTTVRLPSGKVRASIPEHKTTVSISYRPDLTPECTHAAAAHLLLRKLKLSTLESEVKLISEQADKSTWVHVDASSSGWSYGRQYLDSDNKVRS